MVILTAIAAFVLGHASAWAFARLYVRAKVNQSKRRERVWRRIAENAVADPILWSLKTTRFQTHLLAEAKGCE